MTPPEDELVRAIESLDYHFSRGTDPASNRLLIKHITQLTDDLMRDALPRHQYLLWKFKHGVYRRLVWPVQFWGSYLWLWIKAILRLFI